MDFIGYIKLYEAMFSGGVSLEEALSKFKPQNMSDIDIKKCIRAFRKAIEKLPTDDAAMVTKVLAIFQEEADRRGLKIKEQDTK